MPTLYTGAKISLNPFSGVEPPHIILFCSDDHTEIFVL